MCKSCEAGRWMLDPCMCLAPEVLVLLLELLMMWECCAAGFGQYYSHAPAAATAAAVPRRQSYFDHHPSALQPAVPAARQAASAQPGVHWVCIGCALGVHWVCTGRVLGRYWADADCGRLWHQLLAPHRCMRSMGNVSMLRTQRHVDPADGLQA